MGGAYGRDDVVNCLAGCGGVGFVVQKRCVGGVDVAVEAVSRQRGEVVLLRLPFIVGVSIGGEDDKRLTGEVGQRRRMLHRGGALDRLLDEAREVAGGRGIGARLVPRAWRQTAVVGVGDQAYGSEVSGRG